MRIRFVLPLALLTFLCACKDDQKPIGKKASKADTAVATPSKPTPPPPPPRPVAHYTALAMKNNDTAVAYFRQHFSKDEQQVIYALNRIDAGELWRPDTLIIPDTFFNDWKQYSPFPLALPFLSDVHKLVVFSYPIQAFAAYENGRLQKWGPTSMGSKKHKTPTGLHFANWKSKKSVSTVKDEWILPWNFNIMNREGVGWHEYSMPGYPASHSCLRLKEEDAKWLYYWANQWILSKDEQLLAKGTPVLVFGAYPWGERRPWRSLLDDPKANDLSVEELKDEIEPHLPEILAAQKKRAEVEGVNNRVEDTSSIVATP